MKNFDKQNEEVMKMLDTVPGVTEHMQSFEVQIAEKILNRRIELGLTQQQVVELVCEQGDRITQATISKVESGDPAINTETYNKILKALGGVTSLSIEFGELPKSSKTLEYT